MYKKFRRVGSEPTHHLHRIMPYFEYNMKYLQIIIPVFVIFILLSGCGGSDVSGPENLAILHHSAAAFLDSAVITWDTNLPSKGTVYYGLDSTALDSSVADTGEFKTVHEVMLQDLETAVTYYYYIDAQSSDLQTAQSPVDTFYTGISDTLDLLSLTVEVEATEAVIHWATDLPSKGILKYGIFLTNLDYQKYDTTAYITEHSDTIKYLASGTAYYYALSIWSMDNQTMDTDTFSFTTPDDSVFNIYDFTISFLSNTAASIRYYTNKHADSHVYYGFSGEAYSDSLVDNVERLEHQFSLNNLQTESDYALRVVASESSLYMSDTLDTTFSTPAILRVSIPEDTVIVGLVFQYPISIYNAQDLNGMEYYLFYDPDILFAQEIIEGSFSVNAGSFEFYPTINNTAGYIRTVISWNPILIGDVIVGTNADGNGVVAYIEFQAIATGTTQMIMPPDSLIILDIYINPFEVVVDSGSVTVELP